MQALADIDFVSLVFHSSPVKGKDQVLILTRAYPYGIAAAEVASSHPDWHAVWLALPAAGCAVYGPAD